VSAPPHLSPTAPRQPPDPVCPAAGHRRAPRLAGFAILISITLLSFLVLLLLSLSLLTRVGTQMSANNLQVGQAQQNALVGLNIALGQLEKYAGPDQRVTIPAEFGDATLNKTASIPWTMSGSNTTLNLSVPVNPNWPTMGVVSPVAGTRQWTGVWGNQDPGGQIFTKTPTPVLLNWLVSGNEGAAPPNATAYGQFTSAPSTVGMVFTPTMSVTPALSATTTYGTALQFAAGAGPTPAILLVGPSTTGTKSENLNYPTSISGTNSVAQSVTVTIQPQDRYVVAPLVTISTSASLLPGFTGTGAKATGRYGYAVLDEGVKAKVNLRDPFDGQSTPALITSSSTYSGRARMQSALRNGIELVTGFGETPSTTTIAYPVNTGNSTTNSAMDRVLALPELRFLDPNATSSTTDLDVKMRFHDLTSYAFGVLADSQRGGLRRDLTAIFEDPQVFASYTGLNLLPDRDEPSFDLASKRSNTGLLASLDPSMLDPNLPNNPTSLNNGSAFTLSPTRVSPKSTFAYGSSLNGVTVENHGPTWDRLRSFYQLSGQITGSPASVNVQAADPAHMPITPVLVQFRTYFGMVSNGGLFGLRHYLAIILGNPYSVDLVAPKGLNFVILQPGLNNANAYAQGQVGPTNSHGAWNVALSNSTSTDNNSGDEVFSSSLFTGFSDPRQYYTLAPPGSVLPIVNSGMGTVPNNNSVEQNWQVVPDPLASTMGSVLFHASNSGVAGRALTIPAGKLVVLAVNGDSQTVTYSPSYATPPEIELSPLAANAIANPVNNGCYYVYNTKTPVSAGMHTQVNYGDNLSLYMLDPAYTSSSFVAPPYGRVLQAIVGFTMTQGGESATDQTFTADDLYKGGGFIENLALAKGTPWNQTGSNVDGFTFSRGNYFRTYLDYGLTNVYRAIPSSLPNGPWWHVNNCGTVNGYISSFDGDGQANNSLNGFNVYTNNLTGGSGDFGWGYDADLPYADSSTVMFDLPQRLYKGAGNPEESVMSLGYLRHANLSADDEYLSPGYQPASQIGQSFFTPQVTRTASLQLRPNLYFSNNGHANTSYYDLSYLLNAALWDSSFFSTIPTAAASTGQPVNSRLKFAADVVPNVADLGVKGPTATVPDPVNPGSSLPKEYAAARYLMLDGAFNLNSTSVEAWKAVLAGLRRRVAGVNDGVSPPNTSPDTEPTTKPTGYPLSLFQPFDSTGADNVGNIASPSTFGSHGGFRRLTDQQIAALATNIVLEIRARGPFLSLAHFINRTGLTGTVSATLSLSSVTDINDTRTLAGSLQTAIERTGLNSGFPGQPLFGNNFTSHSATSTDYVLGVYTKGYDNGHGPPVTVQSLYADPMPTASNSSLMFSWATLDRSAGIPGWFTQGDLLQALGPSLAARSDTFVVRAYGDVLDPINSTNPTNPVVQARAWCEAVVQRFPDYVDPSFQPYVYPAKTNATDQAFGRRFRIVSFRWLTPNDI